MSLTEKKNHLSLVWFFFFSKFKVHNIPVKCTVMYVPVVMILLQIFIPIMTSSQLADSSVGWSAALVLQGGSWVCIVFKPEFFSGFIFTTIV